MSFHSAGLARALDDMHDFHRQREIAAPILPGRREGERDYSIARSGIDGAYGGAGRSSGAIVSIRLNVRFGSKADVDNYSITSLAWARKNSATRIQRFESIASTE
jgi:hypothetical protein